MNYLKARQRESDKRWDYTLMNDGLVHAAGYCARWLPWPDLVPINPVLVEQYNASRPQHHVDGHATAEEAEACYKTYLLDGSLRFYDDQPSARQLIRCQVADCQVYTSGSAAVGGYERWSLCAEHRTREIVATLLTVGESWES